MKKHIAIASIILSAIMMSMFSTGCKKESSITGYENNSAQVQRPMFQVGNGSNIPGPTDLAVTVTGNSVTLTWTAVANATMYEVVGFKEARFVPTNACTVTGLKDTSYTVKVRVSSFENVNTASRYSEVVSFTIGTPVMNVITKPVITETVTGTKGLNEWYTSDVFVSYTATDGGSPLLSSELGTDHLTAEGASVPWEASAANIVGQTTISGSVKIDKTAPDMRWSMSKAVGAYLIMGGSVNLSATDNVSGVAEGPAINGGGASWPAASTGDFTLTGTASDNAGNSVSVEYPVSVRYNFAGWLQPVTSPITVFNNKANVPVKFIVVDAQNTPVTSGVNVTVAIGGIRRLAVYSSDGFWMANIKLDGTLPPGPVNIELTGNIVPTHGAIGIR